MKRKVNASQRRIIRRFVLFLLVVGALILFVSAVTWSPQGNVDLKYRYNITNGSYIFTNFLDGNLTWTDLYGYPVACPAYSAITQLNDSVTCTSYLTMPNLTVTGNILAANFNVTTEFTAIGEEAGYRTTGTYYTAIGYQAGYESSGLNSVFLGEYAGWQALGDCNTFIGYNSGDATIGNRITAVGEDAGTYSTLNYGVFVGHQAGKTSTGNNSVGVGCYALQNNDANNVVGIGYEAGRDNIVRDQFIVKQANVNGVPLIQGNFSSGNVGIGTISPTNYLTIDGAGMLQLEMNTTSMTCNEANAGSIYYNNNTNKHYGCNVSGWQALY